jgi:fucose permease
VLIYIAFTSLGLPDGLFGAAWPIVREQIGVNTEMGGIYAAVVSSATIFSSLLTNRLVAKLGTGRVLVLSVFITSVSLFIFPLSPSFIHPYVYMCIDGFILGLGAGAVDAALNNYVALHFKARHMSFLHCFWGLGCMISPIVLTIYLTHGGSWEQTYYTIGITQFVFAVILLFSIPMWGKVPVKPEAMGDSSAPHLSNRETLRLPFIKSSVLAFFCYCGYENSMILWISSYSNEVDKLSVEVSALFASIFFGGITFGRFVSGILSEKIGMKRLVRYGCIMALAGIVIVILPLGDLPSGVGVALVGAGAGPFYPGMIYRTPESFGVAGSQSAIGLQMACAYTGSTFVPLILGAMPLVLFPVFILVLIVATFVLSESLNFRKKKKGLTQFS